VSILTVYNGDKTPVQKSTRVTVSKHLRWQNLSCGDAPKSPHNFLAVGAIAPMESAPMMLNQQLI